MLPVVACLFYHVWCILTTLATCALRTRHYRGRTRPEVRTLAQAMTIDDSAERSKFIQNAFTQIEDLDEFVKFVQEGVEYMGNEFRFAVQTNMPPENYDKMKAIYAEAAAIRRSYLQ